MSAQVLNLVPDFTPVASPRSSSMSEAFVKTTYAYRFAFADKCSGTR